MGEPTIEISGPGADEAERDLRDLLRAEFGHKGRRVAPTSDGHGAVMRGDPIAIAALILAIPGAVLATVDLAERAKLRDKAARLVAWAKRHGKPGLRIVLVSPRGKAVDLARAEPGEVVEALTETDRDPGVKAKQ